MTTGTLYTESAVTTGFSAAQEAVSLLATERQQRGRPVVEGSSYTPQLLIGRTT